MLHAAEYLPDHRLRSHQGLAGPVSDPYLLGGSWEDCSPAKGRSPLFLPDTLRSARPARTVNTASGSSQAPYQWQDREHPRRFRLE